MPKPMYVWSGSAWVSVATEVESLATYATQSYADNQPGMKMVVPTSISVGSGSGSVSTQGTVTFSGASSVSLNGCFTSAYDNYLIILHTTASAGGRCDMRLRTSNTDATGGNYSWSGQYNISSANTYSGEGAGTTATAGGITGLDTTQGSLRLTLFKPFLAEHTQWESAGHDGIYRRIYGGIHTLNTSYDGFTIYNTSAGATITGKIRVYGLKNG